MDLSKTIDAWSLEVFLNPWRLGVSTEISSQLASASCFEGGSFVGLDLFVAGGVNRSKSCPSELFGTL